MTADEQGLRRAVEEGLDPLAKLALADLLRERGEDVMAHALEWAARRDRHPRGSPKGRVWTWRRGNALMKRLPSPEYLPAIVFTALLPYGNKTTHKTPWLALEKLAAALERLRLAHSASG